MLTHSWVLIFQPKALQFHCSTVAGEITGIRSYLQPLLLLSSASPSSEILLSRLLIYIYGPLSRDGNLMGILKRRLEKPSKRLVENKQKETGGKRSYHPSVMDKGAQRDLSSRRSNLIWSLIGLHAQSAEQRPDVTC